MFKIKETSADRAFITKALKTDSWFCWYSRNGIISTTGLKELSDYADKHPMIRDIVVVNNIESARPQRTWGSLPAWFRPSSQYNSFDKINRDSHFIFVTWCNNDEDINYTKEDLNMLIESLPTKSQIVIIKGGCLYE